MAHASELVPIAFSHGVANRMSEVKTPAGFARSAQNVDIGADGVVGQRPGYALAAALPGAHSLWAHPELPFALVAASSTLYRVDPSLVLTSLVTTLSGADVHYHMTPLGVYWSDGVACGCINVDGQASSWGVQTPPTCSVAVASLGGLDAGTYAVAITYMNEDGVESGATASQFVTILQGGGITVATPASTDPTIAGVRIYVTTANGQELQYAGSVLAGATYAIGPAPRGRSLRTQYLQPLPALRYPWLKNGRLFGAVGRFLMWSEPLRYGLYEPSKNFIALRGDDITMVAAADTPEFFLYLGTHKRTYKFTGDSLETAALSVLSHSGVIPGSMALVAPDALHIENVTTWSPVWIDTRGVPIAGVQTTVTPLHEKFVYPLFDTTAAAFDQREGNSRYLVSGRGGAPSPLAFSDSVTATVHNSGGGP
jgi:hypothetical protein